MGTGLDYKYVDYSEEWDWWREHYHKMGLSENKIIELTNRRYACGKLRIPGNKYYGKSTNQTC